MEENKTFEEITLTDYRALAAIRYHIRRFMHFSENAARSVGLEPQQHQLLLALKGLPENRKASISDLAERLQIQHHSTVELINRMIERDLIKRVKDETDQRQVIIHLTPHGEQILHQLSLLHREELKSAAPGLIEALKSFIVENDDTTQVAGDE